MPTRTLLLASLLFLLTPTLYAADIELQVGAHVGFLNMEGNGTVRLPVHGYSGLREVPFDVVEYSGEPLLTDSAYGPVGFNWNDSSVPGLGFDIAVSLLPSLWLRGSAEWGWKKTDFDYDAMPGDSFAPVEPNEDYVWAEWQRSKWMQANYGLALDLAPLKRFPNLYLTGGLQYTWFSVELAFNRYTYPVEGPSTTEHLSGSSSHTAFGATAGLGIRYFQRPGVGAGYFEIVRVFQSYGGDSRFPSDSTLFGHDASFDLGGFRITAGYRFTLLGR